jgi:hypothetical protein
MRRSYPSLTSEIPANPAVAGSSQCGVSSWFDVWPRLSAAPGTHRRVVLRRTRPGRGLGHRQRVRWGNGSSRSSANRSGRRAAVGSPPLDPAVYRRAPRPRRPRQSVDLGRPQGPGRRVRLAGLACARSRALQAHRPGVRNRSCAAGAGRHRPQPRPIWRHPRLPCHSNRTPSISAGRSTRLHVGRSPATW